MPGSKGQKAVHACMIRLLNLGPAKHEEGVICVTNQRIPNVCRIAGAACCGAIRGHQLGAKDLGVSKYVLSRLFSKTFHRNFNQYLNDARLNYACHRLENTSDSITNICLDSGFESQRTFNRVFKERYKISPSDYRSICVKEMLS